MSQLFKIPELGDAGISGTVVSMSVNLGDSVACGETLLEVETDKVVLEIPAEVAGVVDSFLIEVGQAVQQGHEFVSMTPLVEQEKPTAEELAPAIEETQTAVEESLVVKDEPAAMIEPSPIPAVTNTVATTVQPGTGLSNKAVSAGPASRRLARELGVDLSLVKGNGFRGRIDKAAVKEFARQALSQQASGAVVSQRLALLDMAAYGAIERKAMSGIQKATSRNMSHAVERVPHAWLQRKIDISALERSRQKYKKQLKEEGVELTLTTLLCKVIALASAQYPIFNTCLDEQAEEIIFRQQINVGVAVDTPRGLVVPVINDVARKSVKDIARNLSALSEKARDGKLKPAEMKGGSITLSNLGGLGASGVFPVINWPEVAILGVGAAEWQATYQTGDVTATPELRLMMPLCLAFDHRVINGADGARFMQAINELCEDPFLMMIS
ncbi:hypothetical protein A9Q82_09380 [Cycloclasticus sp. 46_120_T64]|nr:hypothetical protein A9Q82_09380 [Cycloclasticus sp. 46_120_T64]